MQKPQAKDFHTDDGLHAAMREYADYKSVPGVLHVTAVFKDGSVFTDEIERATEEISYKTRDGEWYSVARDSQLFRDWVYADGDEPENMMKMKVEEHLRKGSGEMETINFEIIYERGAKL